MDCGFIKLWRPYSFGGPRPKPHLAYPWAGSVFFFSFSINKGNLPALINTIDGRVVIFTLATIKLELLHHRCL
ncbi:hypothetical protein Hanom_Chr08g00702481 [Helianthus anomalus]